MYSVLNPSQETRPFQKPQPYQNSLQPYQELVNHIQMCARRAHYHNMQLYNLVISREVNIHTIILICLIKPHISLQQPINIFINFSQWHHQIITMCNVSCNIDCITIHYHIITLKLRKRYLTYTNHFNNSSLSQLL